MAERQYKIKNDELDKNLKTCNSLNLIQLFVQCLKKVKIQYYSYFLLWLSHTFFLLICFTSPLQWAPWFVGESRMDFCCFLFAHYFFLFIVNLFKCSHHHLTPSCYVFFLWPTPTRLCRDHHHHDLMAASRRKALHPVASGVMPPS